MSIPTDDVVELDRGDIKLLYYPVTVIDCITFRKDSRIDEYDQHGNLLRRVGYQTGTWNTARGVVNGDRLQPLSKDEKRLIDSIMKALED